MPGAATPDPPGSAPEYIEGDETTAVTPPRRKVARSQRAMEEQGQPQPQPGVTMLAVATSMTWSLKRRSDDIDEEFEEDKELEEDFDDELDEDEQDDEDTEGLDEDDLDDEFDDADGDGFRSKKGPMQWE